MVLWPKNPPKVIQLMSAGARMHTASISGSRVWVPLNRFTSKSAHTCASLSGADNKLPQKSASSVYAYLRGSMGQLRLLGDSPRCLSCADGKNSSGGCHGPKAWGQTGRSLLLTQLAVATGHWQRALRRAVHWSTFTRALPGGLALPSMAAGFQEGACQEQVFQETQRRVCNSWWQPWKSCCVTSTVSCLSKMSHRASPRSSRGTTWSCEHWEPWLVRRSSWHPATQTTPHSGVTDYQHFFFMVVYISTICMYSFKIPEANYYFET